MQPETEDVAADQVVGVRNLRKVYPETTALDGVSLSVESQEMFGLLGPNGAGKSTLMKILTTVTEPTAGTATVAGYDVRDQPKAVRQKISYIPQQTALDEWLTGRQELRLFARFYELPRETMAERIEEALSTVDLLDRADDEIRTYSGGMQRRLEIASGLINRPAVVILDEPTLGLDPHMRQEIWEYVGRIRDAGATLLISTHYLDEADQLCDRVAIIDRGEILTVDSPADLKASVARDGDAGTDGSLYEVFRHVTNPTQAVVR